MKQLKDRLAALLAAAAMLPCSLSSAAMVTGVAADTQEGTAVPTLTVLDDMTWEYYQDTAETKIVLENVPENTAWLYFTVLYDGMQLSEAPMTPKYMDFDHWGFKMTTYDLKTGTIEAEIWGNEPEYNYFWVGFEDMEFDTENGIVSHELSIVDAYLIDGDGNEIPVATNSGRLWLYQAPDIYEDYDDPHIVPANADVFLDGVLDEEDVIYLRRYLAEEVWDLPFEGYDDTLFRDDALYGDVNGDGAVTPEDLAVLSQYIYHGEFDDSYAATAGDDADVYGFTYDYDTYTDDSVEVEIYFTNIDPNINTIFFDLYSGLDVVGMRWSGKGSVSISDYYRTFCLTSDGGSFPDSFSIWLTLKGDKYSSYYSAYDYGLMNFTMCDGLGNSYTPSNSFGHVYLLTTTTTYPETTTYPMTTTTRATTAELPTTSATTETTTKPDVETTTKAEETTTEAVEETTTEAEEATTEAVEETTEAEATTEAVETTTEIVEPTEEATTETEPELPQTGNNAPDTAAMAAATLTLMAAGAFALLRSGVIGRRKDED